MQKYLIYSVRQSIVYPVTIYGSVQAAFVTSLLIGFLLQVQRYTVWFCSPLRLCPLAATGGELAVTGRIIRLMLQYSFLPTDGRKDCGKNRHPLYSNHTPYYIIHCIQSLQSIHRLHRTLWKHSLFRICTWQNEEIITLFTSNLQVQSAIWGNRIQSLASTDRAYYFCTR